MGGVDPGAAGEEEGIFLPLRTLALVEAVEKPGCSLLTEASDSGILTTSWAFNLKGSLSRLWLASTFQLLAFPEYHLAMVARVSPA